MVSNISFSSVDNGNAVSYGNLNSPDNSGDDISIFQSSDNGSSYAVSEDNIEILEEELDTIKDNNGVFLNGWNAIKEKTGIGTSAAKCEDTIEQYKNGAISYEEALAEIEEYGAKQESSLDLFSNITTGVTAILAGTAAAAAIIASGGTAAPIVVAALAGAGAGAVTKSGIKFTDRATNEIENDALDGKQIAKDAISGAITGAISGATMGNGTTAGTVAQSVTTSAAKAGKTGLVTGAISGASGYTLDCAFDEEKDFNAGELALNTATGALVSGTVGTIMGTANGFLRGNNLISNGGMVRAATDEAGDKIVESSGKYAVENASKEAIIANSVCSTEYKLLNHGIKSTASSIAA